MIPHDTEHSTEVPEVVDCVPNLRTKAFYGPDNVVLNTEAARIEYLLDGGDIAVL